MSLNSILNKHQIQAIFLSKPENIQYFTGFIGSFGQAILSRNKIYLITDPRYTLQAKKLCYPEVEIVIVQDYQTDLNTILKRHRIKNIGFEDTDLSVAQFKSIKKYFKGIKLKTLGKDLDLLREIKNQEEIKLITKSQRINEKTLKEALKLLKTGISEKELAWRIVDLGHTFGAEDISFYPIVAFGENSASPHSTPSQRKYKKSDVILIDMGFKYQGYCSDMTRTFLPKNPNSEQIQVYETVLKAQENCIQNLQIGMQGSQGDKLSREIIEEAGYAENFPHSNGHGVGLEIHESPSLSFKTKHQDKERKIEENMIITVEPGIYLPNKFGVRIEDMIQIKPKKNGNLTKFPKKIKDIILK